jgi:endonuclease/exonuclease/phosphatase family metal-dependent hydrolase
MRNILLMVLFLLYSALIFCQSGDTIKVMTFNIRCQSGEKADDINYWGGRKYLVAELIDKYNPDIIGMQEVEKRQIDDLEVLLEEYSWVGVGRDDGEEAGEFSPIFFNNSKFDVEWDSTFWLSPTPHIPSKGWDAMLNRIATFALFKNKEDGKEFYFFNTHFDHIGDTARVESAKLIIKKIKEIPANFPVILSGDFNITSDSEPYKILTGEKLPDGNPVLYDAQFISSTPHSGGMNSFNGFGKIEEPYRKIDFIFVNDKVSVFTHGIITDKINGLYPSDHFPVLAVVLIH